MRFSYLSGVGRQKRKRQKNDDKEEEKQAQNRKFVSGLVFLFFALEGGGKIYCRD